MLKKITFFVLFISLTQPVLANIDEESIWNTIAPKQFQGDLQYIEDNTFAGKHPFLGAFSCATIIGIPFFYKSIEKSSEIDKNNYWYSRKQDFKNHISLCNNLSNIDEQTKCKISVLQKEKSFTQQHQQALIQMQMLHNINKPQYSHSTTTRRGNTYHTNTYSY